MSNDFLKNIRAGKDKQNPKRRSYDRHQYHYDAQQQYFGNEKRTGQDRRKTRMSGFQEEMMAALKTLMPVLVEFIEIASISQKQMAELETRRMDIEAEKAEALKQLAAHLKSAAPEGGMVFRDTRKKKLRSRKPMDKNRKNILAVIDKLRNEGETFDNIASYLEKEQFQTFSGRGQWHAQTVHRLFQDYILDADE